MLGRYVAIARNNRIPQLWEKWLVLGGIGIFVLAIPLSPFLMWAVTSHYGYRVCETRGNKALSTTYARDGTACPSRRGTPAS